MKLYVGLLILEFQIQEREARMESLCGCLTSQSCKAKEASQIRKEIKKQIKMRSKLGLDVQE